MTAEQLRRRRAAAQLLGQPERGGGPDGVAAAPGGGTPGAATAAGTVAHLLAVQAQDLRAARLALRARGAAATAADVDAALHDGSLVITWLMRGTLHLVARDDLGWLHALTGGLAVPTIRRRLAELDVDDPQRGVEVIEAALADAGPLDRAALTERLRAAGVPAEGQAVPHLLGLAASRGGVVLAGEAYTLIGDRPAPPDRDAAIVELARRYLRGHGPATAADLARWSGLGLRDVRAGLGAIGGDLTVDGDLVDLAGRGEATASPPRLLPGFDPYLLGWKDRSFAVDPAHARRVHPGGGMIRATAVDDGAVVGTWTMPGGRVELDLFACADAEAFAAEVRGVERF